MIVAVTTGGGPPREADPGVAPSVIISALNHPLRRSILRLLLEQGPSGATQMADRLPYVSRNSVRSHLDTLADSGMAKKEKPPYSRESVYSPTAAPRIPWVATVLRLTVRED